MKIKNIVEYKNYGVIKLNLKKLMKERNISIYQLSNSTNIGFKTIKNLCENENLVRIDLDVLSKLCYAFDATPNDILEYELKK